MMLDMKAELKKDPEYISYMGGYFGMYGDKPLYCFSKLHYLAGVVGLPKDKADKIAIRSCNSVAAGNCTNHRRPLNLQD